MSASDPALGSDKLFLQNNFLRFQGPMHLPWRDIQASYITAHAPPGGLGDDRRHIVAGRMAGEERWCNPFTGWVAGSSPAMTRMGD